MYRGWGGPSAPTRVPVSGVVPGWIKLSVSVWSTGGLGCVGAGFVRPCQGVPVVVSVSVGSLRVFSRRRNKGVGVRVALRPPRGIGLVSLAMNALSFAVVPR